jgi:hypothetical protein
MFAPNCAEIPRLASGFTGREFYDLGRDLLLPHEALARLQPGEFALDLFSRRGHSFHARLILGREGVQPRTAKLCVHVVRSERTNEIIRHKV